MTWATAPARLLARNNASYTRPSSLYRLLHTMTASDYASWTNEQLIARVTNLEQQLKKKNDSYAGSAAPTIHAAPSPPSPIAPTATSPPSPTKAPFLKPKKPAVKKTFDPTRYSMRLVALKFAYLGQRYNGFEHHPNNTTPLPTIEEELWKALVKTKLIFPTGPGDVNWEGCEYSKCGRTDKGVSAFGQVIALRVRSNRPKQDTPEPAPPFDDVADELPYARLLNRVLPPDIRVYAWCAPPQVDFSARFSCRERRYRYFFTQPAYSPLPGTQMRRDGSVGTDGYLDLAAMRDAAARYVGLHDFRNFCKIDAAKQISNYERRIFWAGIEEMGAGAANLVTQAGGAADEGLALEQPRVYALTVFGSAFLWHQIRHMVAVLFLVGQGLERPEIVDELLDMARTPSRPFYEMADDAPLVLWDCIFPDLRPDAADDTHTDALPWVYADAQPTAPDRKQAFSSAGDGRHGPHGMHEVLWELWRKRKMDEILARSLLDLVAAQTAGGRERADSSFGNPLQVSDMPPSTRQFAGSDSPRMVGKYVPFAKRGRMEPPDVVNARWLLRKGASRRRGARTPASGEASPASEAV